MDKLKRQNRYLKLKNKELKSKVTEMETCILIIHIRLKGIVDNYRKRIKEK